MTVMKGLDCGRKTARLTRESGQHEMASAFRHGMREFAVGVAGRLRALEHHLRGQGLKSANPVRIGQHRIEEWRLADHAQKSDGQSDPPRMREREPAILQRLLRLRN